MTNLSIRVGRRSGHWGQMMNEPLKRTLGVLDLSDELLTQALTHRSYSFENGGLPHNERLEFLGDSVLGLVVTHTLYLDHPDLPEGRLAKLRSAVVSARSLAEVAKTLGLGDHILLGKGEEATGGRLKPSILSDTLEAVIGAVFVQFGIERAAEVVHIMFDPVMAAAAQLGAGLDWKTSLQEITSSHGLGVPVYHIHASGPDHLREFSAQVEIGDATYGPGEGRSKKEAEQKAAQLAWEAIHNSNA